jgi:hypothetical protein
MLPAHNIHRQDQPILAERIHELLLGHTVGHVRHPDGPSLETASWTRGGVRIAERISPATRLGFLRRGLLLQILHLRQWGRTLVGAERQSLASTGELCANFISTRGVLHTVLDIVFECLASRLATTKHTRREPDLLSVHPCNLGRMRT